MDPLTIFGLVAVTAMLVTYTLEDRSPWWIVGFAIACLLAGAYGFLQGAWPFGLVETIWAGFAMRRARRTMRVGSPDTATAQRAAGKARSAGR